MCIRTQTNGDRTYLLLVENERVNGRLVQRVLHRLGRLDHLQASGQLDAVLKSLGRFSDKLLVLDAHARGASVTTKSSGVGPAWIVERLWREGGVGEVLTERLAGRRFDFAVERAVFLTVLHRLMAPGSDRAAERWRHDYTIPGTEDLELHQLYRAMAWLGEPLPPAEQTAATPFARAPRRIWSRKPCLPGAAICSAAWIWCSSTRPRSISTAPGARPSAGTATRGTIGRT